MKNSAKECKCFKLFVDSPIKKPYLDIFKQKIMVKRVFSLLILIVAFTQLSFGQKNILYWQSSSLEINGNDADWALRDNILRFYDSASNIKYEMRNDENNLYLIFESDDRSLQQQIMMGGLSLKLKVKDKSKRVGEFVINAHKHDMMQPQLGNKNDRTNNQGQNEEEKPQSLDEMAKPKFEMPKDTAFLSGFAYAPEYVVAGELNEDTIGFSFNKDRKVQGSTLELAIPLADLFGDNYNLNNISSTAVQLQLIINAVSTSGKSDFSTGMQGGRSGGMGGPGGGMGGGPGGGMGSGPGGGMGGSPGGGMGGDQMGGGSQQPPSGMPNMSSMGTKKVKIEFYIKGKD